MNPQGIHTLVVWFLFMLPQAKNLHNSNDVVRNRSNWVHFSNFAGRTAQIPPAEFKKSDTKQKSFELGEFQIK